MKIANRIAILIVLLSMCLPSFAAVTKFSATNGNFSATTPWEDCDSTAENDSEAATAVPPTSGGATSDATGFTAVLETVDAVAIKLATRSASPTGTITVVLRQAGADVVGTSVTVNVSLLPAIGTTATPGGWALFKFASPVTLTAGLSYIVRVTTTSSSQVTLYASSGNNWSRQVRISGVSGSAPTTGDKLIIGGDLTAASGLTTYTVTYDVTAATVWGASAAGQAIAVNLGGTLSQQVTASTAYVLNFLGRFHVAGGGSWIMAGGGAMPSTSSLTVTAQNAANVDCGFEWGAQGTVTLTGATVTSVQTKLTIGNGGLCNTNGTAVTGLEGQSFTGLTGTIRINSVNYTISSVTDSTHLVLTGSAGVQSTVAWVHAGTGTTVTVGSTTGWAANGLVCFASTTKTPADCEEGSVNSVSSGTVAVLNTALANYHSADTSPYNIQAEVGYLTRNVIIQGNTSSFGTYINVNALSTIALAYVGITKIGSATANKRGIDVATTTGSFSMTYCSTYDCTVASSIALNVAGGAWNNLTYTHNIIYNVPIHIVTVATTGTNYTFDTLYSILDTVNTQITFGDVGGTITNITVVGQNTSNRLGLLIQEAVASLGVPITGTINNLTVHSCNGGGAGALGILSATGGSVSNVTVWRNANGLEVSGQSANFTISNATMFGNTLNIIFATTSGITLTGFTCNSGINLTSTYGILLGSILTPTYVVNTYIENSTFGVTNGFTTCDVGGNNGNASTGFYQMYFANCNLASTTPINISGVTTDVSFLSFQKWGQTNGSHRVWTPQGICSTDTAIFDVTPSERLTPSLSTAKLQSAFYGRGLTVPLASGNALTVSVKVRESVAGDGTAYNGAHIRLLVRKNVAMGITADTVLATATAGAAGALQTLTGTTANVTDDGALEFFCDCDGTQGWCNIDTWTATGAYTGTYGTDTVWYLGSPYNGITSGGGVKRRTQ